MSAEPLDHVHDVSACDTCRRREVSAHERAVLMARWDDHAYRFVIPQGGLRIHAKGSSCYPLELLLQLCDYGAGGDGSHHLVRYEEAMAWMAEERQRRPCRVCCPDINEPPRSPKKIRHKRSPLGWPTMVRDRVNGGNRLAAK